MNVTQGGEKGEEGVVRIPWWWLTVVAGLVAVTASAVYFVFQPFRAAFAFVLFYALIALPFWLLARFARRSRHKAGVLLLAACGSSPGDANPRPDRCRPSASESYPAGNARPTPRPTPAATPFLITALRLNGFGPDTSGNPLTELVAP